MRGIAVLRETFSKARAPLREPRGRPRVGRRLPIGIALAIACATLANPSRAQDDASPVIDLSLDFAMGFPQGPLEDNIDNAGYGFTAFAGAGLPEIPLTLGAEIGFLVYDSESSRQPLSSSLSDVNVDVDTDSSILLAHLVARLQPRTWTVQPYAEGLIGLKHFFTDTTVQTRISREVIAKDTNHDDTALSYGAGAGIVVALPFGETGPGRVRGVVTINAGARYLFGSKAEYARAGSLERRNQRTSFDVESSSTDLIVTQLGFGIIF